MEQTLNEAVLQGFDARLCPDPVPDGMAFVMPYIGGSSASHVWTGAELARVAHLPRLPIWVPTPGTDNPRQAALGAVSVMRSLGIPPGPRLCHEQCALLWDMETGTEPDPRWYNTAADVLWSHGYANVGYASPDVAAHLPIRSGLIVARPGTPPAVGPMAGEIGTQYRWGERTPGGTIDLDVLRESALRLLWLP